MRICRGHIVLRSRKEPTALGTLGTQSTTFCDICFSILSEDESSKTSCLNSNCRLMCHLSCLANEFLDRHQYIPISGRCPLCRQTIIWGELVRKRNGCVDTIILIDDEWIISFNVVNKRTEICECTTTLEFKINIAWCWPYILCRWRSLTNLFTAFNKHSQRKALRWPLSRRSSNM